MQTISRSLLFIAACCVIFCSWASPASAAPGGSDFDECGVLVQGPVCLQFQTDLGDLYFLGDFGTFAPGDRVQVVGAVFNSPAICLPPMCTGGYTGCVLGNTIESCETASFFCFGDGGVSAGCTPCICGNNSPIGSTGGCLNSTGTSGSLTASGIPSVAADTLRIEARDLNPGTFAILISGASALPAMGMCPPGAGIQNAVLDGLRCVGGDFKRHGTRLIDPQGEVGTTTAGWGVPNSPSGGLSLQGGFVAGQTRNFQIFYRESALLVCQSGQNTTNAARVIFRP